MIKTLFIILYFALFFNLSKKHTKKSYVNRHSRLIKKSESKSDFCFENSITFLQTKKPVIAMFERLTPIHFPLEYVFPYDNGL